MVTKEGNDVIWSFLGRLIVGAIGWGVGAAVLIAIMILGAAPYGGGSAGPLYLVILWTAVVIYWVLRPLRRLPILARPMRMLLIYALALGSALVAMNWWTGAGQRERAKVAQVFTSAFEQHSAYFKKVCAAAGPRVFRQVLDVEGFVVFGIRAKPENDDLNRKDFVGDVFSGIDTSYDPEASFVRHFLTKMEWEARWYVPTSEETNRYSLIEIPTELDGVSGYYRYTDASKGSEQKSKREFSKEASSKYAVQIKDISTAADREHWIAGTKWSVVEQKTREVLGEFIAYAMDPLQGQTVFEGGFGQAGEPWAPWRRAGHVQYRTHGVQNACPEKDIFQQRLNARDFVRSVLVPIKQEVRINQ